MLKEVDFRQSAYYNIMVEFIRIQYAFCLLSLGLMRLFVSRAVKNKRFLE